MDRHRVDHPALFLEVNVRTLARNSVIPDFYSDHRADSSEGVHEDAQQRPIKQRLSAQTPSPLSRLRRFWTPAETRLSLRLWASGTAARTAA